MGNIVSRGLCALLLSLSFAGPLTAGTVTYTFTDIRSSGGPVNYRFEMYTSKRFIDGQPGYNYNTATLSPGQTASFNISMQAGASIFSKAKDHDTGSNSGPWDWESGTVAQDSGTFPLNVGAAPPPTLCSVTSTVLNTKPYPILVEWFSYYPAVGGLPESETFLVQKLAHPGQTVSHTLEAISPAGDCSDTPELRAYELGRELDENFEYNQTTNLVSSENTTTNASTVIVNSDNLPAWTIDGDQTTNGPIDWGSATTDGEILKYGFSSSLIYQNAQDTLQNSLLSSIKTNTTPSVVSQGDIDSASAVADTYADAVDQSSSVSLTTSFGGSVPSMLVTVAPGIQVDLNPFNHSSLSTVASAIRTFLLWVSSLLFLSVVVKELKVYIAVVLLAPQASAASSSPVISSASALAMATAIAAIVGSAAVLLVTYVTSLSIWSLAMTSPLGSGALGNAATFINAIVPVAHLISLVIAYYVFHFSANAIMVGAAISVRFFVGCLFFGLFVSDVGAATVDINNATGTNVTFGAYVLQPGQTVIELPGDTYTVVGPSGSGSSVVPTSDLTRTMVTIGDTGTTLLLTTRTVDYLEPFWSGAALALTMWSFGFILRKLRQADGTYSGD